MILIRIRSTVLICNDGQDLLLSNRQTRIRVFKLAERKKEEIIWEYIFIFFHDRNVTKVRTTVRPSNERDLLLVKYEREISQELLYSLPEYNDPAMISRDRK